MEITKKSSFSGEIHTRDIPITEEEYLAIINRFNTGMKIQQIVPHLSAEDREFLMTGATPEEWNKIFKPL